MSNAIVNKDDGKSTLSADESNVNDTTALLGKSSTNSNIKPCGDNISPLTIDEMVETLGFGVFHILIVIITGLCFSGFAIYYQSISVITLAACELDINNHNKL